jgi:hypothetical protein|nr:MAG TPA: Polymerase cofactor VP35-coil, VIRAL PROTEIN.43A [Caudoviricetes sp.]
MELIDNVIAHENLKLSELEGRLRGLRYQSTQIQQEIDNTISDMSRVRSSIQHYTNMKRGELDE